MAPEILFLNQRKIYNASDVHEAVEMAEKFKAEGIYDWFRGQTQDWPPYSTAFRRRLQEDNTQALRFMMWATLHKGLEPLLKDPDTLAAVAQHYGVPTNLIDFTTEPCVAGFFACEGEPPPSDRFSCIYCLNMQHLEQAWETYAIIENAAKLDFVRIEVPNLWRLEAQAGVFVGCEINWDVIYPMDRILFPWTGHPIYPPRSRIYPDQKSQLKILLDHYFAMERNRLGNMAMEEFLATLKKAGANVVEPVHKDPEDFYHKRLFVSGELPMLASWDEARLRPWLELEKELFEETVDGEVRLSMEFDADPAVVRKRVALGVRAALQRNQFLRLRAVRWIPDRGNMDPGLALALSALWNGLRRLPFSNEDIAEALALCAALHRAGVVEGCEKDEVIKLLHPFLGEVLEVEFAAVDITSSRGYVSNLELRNAVRPDIKQRFLPEKAFRAESVESILLARFSPKRLLDFDKLATLFARQIAPTEVLLRGRGVVFFSPARLLTFGLP